MKKGLIIFLVIIFFFCLEGQAATTCYDNSNCSENQKCIRMSSDNYFYRQRQLFLPVEVA